MSTLIILIIVMIVLLFITATTIVFYSRLKLQLEASNTTEKAELIATRKQLELAINAADISIWVFHCNERMFSSFYGKTIPLPHPDYDSSVNLIVEPYRTKYITAIDRLINNISQKEVAICKLRNKKDNADIYYETQMAVSELNEDGTVKSIVGTLKDITYQYIYKEELENKEKKTRLAIQTSDLVQWEYNNIIHLFNADNEHINGGAAVLTSEDYYNAVHPEDRIKVKEIIEQMDEGDDRTFLFHKRLRYSDDDNWHYTTVYGAPLEKDINGKVIKYTGFRRDDTEWKNLNERLEEEKMKAQEADKVKSIFLANMSHEIRTPLNAIVGFSQLLLTTDNLQEKEEYCNIINVNNDLLLSLINDILDLSKIESGMMGLKRETFDLVPFFDDYVTTMKQRIKNPEVELIPVNPYHKCVVNLDKNRMAQIFTNFVTNAIKYTPKGYIKIGYEYMNKGIRLYVEDSGIGIPKEKQHHIFERFEKLDTFAQGTGLGLSICKAISDAVNGDIGFESELGKGSTFWAWSGCDVEIETKNTGIVEKPEKKQIQYNSPSQVSTYVDVDILVGQRILIAEDKDSNYLLLKSMLKHATVDRACNGIEAVEKAQMNPYNLILMDICMPYMDGMEATQRIRKFDKEIPIVAITANAFYSDRIDTIAAGCNDFITKPIKKQDLFTIIEKMLINYAY